MWKLLEGRDIVKHGRERFTVDKLRELVQNHNCSWPSMPIDLSKVVGKTVFVTYRNAETSYCRVVETTSNNPLYPYSVGGSRYTQCGYYAGHYMDPIDPFSGLSPFDIVKIEVLIPEPLITTMDKPSVKPSVKRSSFFLKMWDDEETQEKLQFLGNLETMFDHSKNLIPEGYFDMEGNLSPGSRIKVTFEVMGD